MGAPGTRGGELGFREHLYPASLPSFSPPIALGLGRGLGCARYLARRRRLRGAPGTAGFRVPLECSGARGRKVAGRT